MLGRICLLLALLSSLVAAADPTRIVFVTGDHEYSGEQTLPILASALESRFGFRTLVLKASPDQNAEENIPNLEALRSADVAVFFLRWRQLPAEQLAHIEAYVKSGKPVMGFRTTSHAFNYPKGDPREAWNRWGADVLGTPPGWGAEGHTHFGHQSSTDVRVAADQRGNPILEGVDGAFHVRSWLYRVVPNWPPPDAVRLLIGKAVEPNKPAEENPVAWTWTNRYGGRAFYTSLGHPEDFAVETVQRLTVNAVHWCLGLRPPRWDGRIPMDVPYRGMTAAPTSRASARR